MHHQSQKSWGVLVGILLHQKGYLIYVPITLKVFSSHDIVFDETFSSVLAYTSHPYLEALLRDQQSHTLHILYISISISIFNQPTCPPSVLIVNWWWSETGA